jgi:hypothetical protein
MSRLETFNDRFGLYYTNRLKRYDNYIDPTGNFIISQSDTPSPTMSNPATYSREYNEFWESAITTTTNTNWPYFISDYNKIDLNLGTGSSLISIDNFLGSRWGITGGSGQYSVEFPGFIQQGFTSSQPYEVNCYFSFDEVANTTTPTYIAALGELYEDSGDRVTYSVVWVENGVSVKTVTTNRVRLKMLWDKNTNMSYVYGTTNYPSSVDDYLTLIGTYSFNSTYTQKPPYGYVGWLPKSDITWTLLSNGPLIISNYQIRGLTGSNFGTSSVYPPVSQIFGSGHYNI